MSIVYDRIQLWYGICILVGMHNEINGLPFSATRQDISNLKLTAKDALEDIKSTVLVHASKAKSEVQDLNGNFQKELGQIVSERPVACVGMAFVAGLFLGLKR